MSKYKKPLRSIWDELYDADTPWERRQELKQAYRDFLGTLEGRARWELKMLLM